MKEEFEAYLRELKMPNTLRNRVEAALEFYKRAGLDEVIGIFVSDYIDEAGTRQYESLILFTQSCVMEAKQFITDDNFDVTVLKNRVAYAEVRKQAYDFTDEWNEQSRMVIRLDIGAAAFSSLGVSFKAARQNCKYLRDVWMKFIRPNLTP